MSHTTSNSTPPRGYLSGQLLVATPLVMSPGFSRSVIFMCSHNEDGAMGIIINHIIENISYKDLFDQLSIASEPSTQSLSVHYGGPVEINRGFVIYDSEAEIYPETMMTSNHISVSSSLHVLRDIASGNGPQDKILALGYAGWSAGQLETELESNSWISVPATRDLIFAADNTEKWQRAGQIQGIDISRITTTAGHA